MDSEETPGDSMIVSSSTMITEVRLLIVYIIVDVNVILVTVALRRVDRMHVGHVQNLIRLSVQQMLINSNSTESVRPTQLVLSVIWKFRMMFFAMYIPTEERIIYNGYIITFLFAWYHYVKNTSALSEHE